MLYDNGLNQIVVVGTYFYYLFLFNTLLDIDGHSLFHLICILLKISALMTLFEFISG